MKVYTFLYYSIRSQKVKNTVPENMRIYYIGEKASER